MLKNINNVQELLNLQQEQTVNNKQFFNYTSKISLINSGKLTKQQQQVITSIKNCFTFSLHKGLKYLCITMYFSKNKTYNYIVLNLETSNIKQFSSIKQCKQYVLKQVQQKTSNK